MRWAGLLTFIVGAFFVAISASGEEANWLDFYFGLAMLVVGAVLLGIGVRRHRMGH